MTTISQASVDAEPAEEADESAAFPLRAYLLAIIATALTFLLRWMIGFVIGDLPMLILFVIPIAISAYIGGLGPGLLATGLGALGSLVFLLPPNSINPSYLANGMVWTMLIVVGVVVSFFSELLHRSRRRLEANSGLLSTTLTSIGDAVITADLLGGITFINWEAARLTGFEPEDAIGRPLKSVFRIIDEGTRQPLEDPVQKVTNGNTEVGIIRDILLVARDGTEIPIEESSAPIRDQDGPVQGVVVVFSDCSLKQQADSAIKERVRMQEQLVKIASTAPGVIHEFEQRPDGSVCFPYSSQRIQQIYDLRPEDLATDGSAALQRIHAEDIEPVQRSVADSARTLNPWRAEFRVHNPQKGLIWVEGHSTPQREPDGTIRWYGFLNDITERKTAEENLERANERLHAALRAGQMGTWDWDLSNYRATWDQNLNALLGRDFQGTPEQAVDFFVSCVHPDDRSTLERAMEACYGGKDFSTEYRVVLPDGSNRWLAARGVLRREPDGRLRMVGACVDITQHKQLEADLAQAKEAAEATNRAKDYFLAMLSHELRTPLTPVLLLASATERDPRLPEDLRTDLSIIRENAQAEARLIDDLLDLTRIALGKLRLRIDDADVHVQIQRAIDVCREEAQSRGQRFATELKAEHFHVNGDAQRLLQVFWNLIQNASKYSGDNARIVIRTRNQMRNGSLTQRDIAPGAIGVNALPEPAPGQELLIVEIQDSGVGIPATAMQRIFEPFEQAHRTLQNGVGGIGLGLTISKAIVEVHRGAILVESGGPNRGAIFTLQLLTRREPEPEPAPTPVIPEQKEAPPAPAKRILLVEDHVMTARNLQRLIQTEGYEVAIARDIASAKQMLQTERFDVLLADLGLPDGDGTELMHFLKAIGSSIPGIVLSGFGMEADIQRTREAGFEAHLVKPVTAEQLMETLSRVLTETRS